eukprot:gene3617-4648_t
MGLIGVVSLPRVFVFRVNPDDPHPAPWIRVKLSCALGEQLFPHPQWRRVAALWDSFYPLTGLAPEQRRLLLQLEDSLPALAGLLARHRPALLRGRTLPDVLAVRARQPRRLASLFLQWSVAPQRMYDAAPSLAFAVLGQARADGRLSPEHESVLLGRLLTHWALRSTLDLSALCGDAAQHPQHRRTEYHMANIKNAAAKADLRGAVQVTVHDSLTGAPLVNAAIKLYKAQTQQGAPMLECDVEEVRVRRALMGP